MYGSAIRQMKMFLCRIHRGELHIIIFFKTGIQKVQIFVFYRVYFDL